MAQSDVQNTRSYRGLLALVIVLGILIVLGVIGLIVGFALRLPRAQAVGPFSAVVSAPGERLDGAQFEGNRVLLRLSGPRGDEIVIMDITGRMLGRIVIDTRR
jgi:hypothetical protein